MMIEFKSYEPHPALLHGKTRFRSARRAAVLNSLIAIGSSSLSTGLLEGLP